MKPIGIFLLSLTLLICASCSLWPWKGGARGPRQKAAQQSSQQAQGAPSPQKAPAAETVRGESVKLAYRSADLTLAILADPQLNRFQSSAHTLLLCVYQLKDPNAFLQLSEEKEGIPRLLECSRFDGSVANARRLVVQPGQNMNESRDRAEGARFIGIAAGYYGTGKQRLSALKPLPVANGDFSGSIIEIELGAYEIEKVTVK